MISTGNYCSAMHNYYGSIVTNSCRNCLYVYWWTGLHDAASLTYAHFPIAFWYNSACFCFARQMECSADYSKLIFWLARCCYSAANSSSSTSCCAAFDHKMRIHCSHGLPDDLGLSLLIITASWKWLTKQTAIFDQYPLSTRAGEEAISELGTLPPRCP